ncbi:PREDICTED: F-box protein At2g15640-like [Ipomoea nil]|uniref:F-box protein At2g15640-like n=1 Tax=Ipomoea nil TaxID=35883 RepID=UPI000901AA73|nr:PREDICTED: F-box protein At2g15640-like [Ipomoea nil]
MSVFLPIDLWVEVLAKLPAKSIFRWATVSRSWYYLIKTPYFIYTNLDFNSQNDTRISCILMRSCVKPRGEIYEFYDDNDCNLTKFVEFRAPFKAENLFFRIIGCCNGLIFLFDDFFKNHHDMIIWNPFIWRWVCLLEPPNFVHSKSFFGFRFDYMLRMTTRW